MGSAHILVEKINGWGILILNRPSSLNALTPDMIVTLYNHLRMWQHDSDINGVIIRAQPDCRAFCAGGDVRMAWQMAQDQNPAVYEFFASEYRLNHLIHHYKKLVIAVIDGIVMGGGAGISMHARYRIVTERALFAMPETAIGFIPDVGSSWFLNRCPEPFGMYLALTGDRIGAGDMGAAGLATHYIPETRVYSFIENVLNLDINDIECYIDSTCEHFPVPDLIKSIPAYQHILCQNAFEDVWAESMQDDSGNRLTELLKIRCPLSVVLTWNLMREMKGKNVEECLQTEFRIVCNLLNNINFREGVRAVLVDKDNHAQWNPPDLSTIDSSMIAMMMDSCHVPTLEFDQ